MLGGCDALLELSHSSVDPEFLALILKNEEIFFKFMNFVVIAHVLPLAELVEVEDLGVAEVAEA